MHRSMFGIKRTVTASAVAFVVGAGLLAMTSAAEASLQATAGPKAAATAATAISGDWEGSYTCGSAATGLDLDDSRLQHHECAQSDIHLLSAAG